MSTAISPTLSSPDGDQVFSTPQMTPSVEHNQMIPRHNSRPTSLHIDHLQDTDWNPDITVDTSTTVSNISDTQDADNSSVNQHKSRTLMESVDSPCFVHSHLDKNASLTDWLKTRSAAGQLIIGDLGVAKSLQHSASAKLHITNGVSAFSRPGPDRVSSRESDVEEDEFVGSLTKQLAETAVGVREMSKQLGMVQVPLTACPLLYLMLQGALVFSPISKMFLSSQKHAITDLSNLLVNSLYI